MAILQDLQDVPALLVGGVGQAPVVNDEEIYAGIGRPVAPGVTVQGKPSRGKRVRCTPKQMVASKRFEWPPSAEITTWTRPEYATEADALPLAKNFAGAHESRRFAGQLKKLEKFHALFFSEGTRDTLVNLRSPFD